MHGRNGFPGKTLHPKNGVIANVCGCVPDEVPNIREIVDDKSMKEAIQLL